MMYLNSKFGLFILLALIFTLASCEQENLPTVESLDPTNEELSEEENSDGPIITVNEDLVIYNGETFAIDDPIIVTLLEKETTTFVTSYPINYDESVGEHIELISYLFDGKEAAESFLEVENQLSDRASCQECFDLFLYDNFNQGHSAIMHNIKITYNPRTYNIPWYMNDRTSAFHLRSDHANWGPTSHRNVKIWFHVHRNGQGWAKHYSAWKPTAYRFSYIGVLAGFTTMNNKASSIRVRATH